MTTLRSARMEQRHDCAEPWIDSSDRAFALRGSGLHESQLCSLAFARSHVPLASGSFCSASSCCLDLRQPVSRKLNYKLAPQDKVEIYFGMGCSDVAALQRGLVLNDVFTIGTEGLLDLPIIGRVPAAGLPTDELEKLITYRLQARSGFAIRPLVVRALTVQRRQSAASSDSARIEPPPPSAVKPSADGSRTLGRACCDGATTSSGTGEIQGGRNTG